MKLIADGFGCTIDLLVSDEDVQSKRETEDRQSLRLYFAAVACAVAAVLTAAIGICGELDLRAKAIEGKVSSLRGSRAARTKEGLVEFFAKIAAGLRTDKEILEVFINQAWVYGDKVVATMNFDENLTTKYEIDLIMKDELPGQRAVRLNSIWLPG